MEKLKNKFYVSKHTKLFKYFFLFIQTLHLKSTRATRWPTQYCRKTSVVKILTTNTFRTVVPKSNREGTAELTKQGRTANEKRVS